MPVAAQLIVIFLFGLVVSGVVFLGVLRAREVSERAAKAETAGERR